MRRVIFAMLMAVPTWAQFTPPSGGSGTGTVTQINTTGPITGGPITTNGTVACPTCVATNVANSFSALQTFGSSIAGATASDAGQASKPFRYLYLYGDGSFGSNAFQFKGNPSAARTFTLPDAASNPVQGIANPSDTNVVNYISTDGVQHRIAQSGGGTGTVTSFSAGTLSPLFTTSVATATTTPALSFALSNFAADSIFGNFTGSSAAPSTQAIPSCANDGAHALVYASHTLTCEAITTGGTGTVTNFSAGTLSPLFTTSVATSTSTPALSFSLSNAAQNTLLAGPPTGGAGAPSYQLAPTFSGANMTNLPITLTTTGSSGAATYTQATNTLNVPQYTGGSGVSVFTGSTGSTISSSATPVFSLADVSVKSPIRFEISPVVNVTGPTITNTSAGARFDIAVTTDGTHTWTWNSIVSDNVCPIYTAVAATTIASLEIGVDGTTVHGVGCQLLINGLTFYGASVSASSTNPGSGNMDARMTSSGYDVYDGTSHWTMIKGGGGTLTGPASSGTATITVASGTASLGTSSISSTACATVVTVSATGVASTDAITFTPNASIKAVTGYTPATTGGLTVNAYPTSGNVNFDVCNWSTGSITPGSVTLNWRVTR